MMNVQISIRADKDELLRAAREEAYSTPLKDFHPGAPKLFQNDTLWPWFERLRKEEPVHYCTNAPIEPYWSVVKYNDIMHVDTSHGVFSSDAALGGISIRDVPPGYDYPSFIAMDQPRHSAQRKTVSPMFTPTHLDELAKLIRERSQKVLDNLPRNETFNFVERVSIELTTQMLATLFDFPWDERRKLTRWSDVSTALPKSGVVESPEQRRQEMDECYAYFSKLWNERGVALHQEGRFTEAEDSYRRALVAEHLGKARADRELLDQRPQGLAPAARGDAELHARARQLAQACQRPRKQRDARTVAGKDAAVARHGLGQAARGHARRHEHFCQR